MCVRVCVYFYQRVAKKWMCGTEERSSLTYLLHERCQNHICIYNFRMDCGRKCVHSLCKTGRCSANDIRGGTNTNSMYATGIALSWQNHVSVTSHMERLEFWDFDAKLWDKSIREFSNGQNLMESNAQKQITNGNWLKTKRLVLEVRRAYFDLLLSSQLSVTVNRLHVTRSPMASFHFPKMPRTSRRTNNNASTTSAETHTLNMYVYHLYHTQMQPAALLFSVVCCFWVYFHLFFRCLHLLCRGEKETLSKEVFC